MHEDFSSTASINLGRAAGYAMQAADACQNDSEPMPEVAGLPAVYQRLMETVKALDHLAAGIEQAEVRLNGGRPEKAGGSTNVPRSVPNGTISQLHSGLDDMAHRIQRAHVALGRIQRSL